MDHEKNLGILNKLLWCCVQDVHLTGYFGIRGLTEDTCFTYELGFFGSRAVGYLNGLSTEDARYVTDVLGINKLFIGCPVFPLRNEYNDIIGLTARTDDARSKYLHSKSKKSSALFGLSVVKNLVWFAKEVFVTEGPFDVMRAYQGGVRNVCGILGATMSSKQIELLAKYADKIWLVLDTDRAGVEGAQKTAEIIKSRYCDLDVEVVHLPKEVKDWNDYCDRFGTALFTTTKTEYGLREAMTAMQRTTNGVSENGQ